MTTRHERPWGGAPGAAAVGVDDRRPGEALARFWEARGFPVFEAGGVLWGRYSRLYHVTLPYHLELDPDPAELQRALRAARVLAARYASRSGRGVASAVWVCPARGYSLASVDRRHRNKVRRGLERCEIRPIELDELLSQGLELNRSTLHRQRRVDPELTEGRRWARFVAAVAACPEITALGAFVDRRLSAYNIVCSDGGWMHLLFKASRVEEHVHHTNPALEYSLLLRAARDPSVEAVTAGLVPLGDERRDPYKEGMGYRLVPQRVVVELHPAARPVLTNALAVEALAVRSRLQPGSARWRVVAATARAARASRRRGHGQDAAIVGGRAT